MQAEIQSPRLHEKSPLTHFLFRVLSAQMSRMMMELRLFQQTQATVDMVMLQNTWKFVNLGITIIFWHQEFQIIIVEELGVSFNAKYARLDLSFYAIKFKDGSFSASSLAQKWAINKKSTIFIQSNLVKMTNSWVGKIA